MNMKNYDVGMEGEILEDCYLIELTWDASKVIDILQDDRAHTYTELSTLARIDIAKVRSIICALQTLSTDFIIWTSGNHLVKAEFKVRPIRGSDIRPD